MLALLYALYAVGGRASYEVMRVLLEHADTKGVRALAARAEDEGLVRRPKERGGQLELSAQGVACIVGKLRTPAVAECMAQNRALRQRAA